jgi:acyl-CoA oxidase
MHQFIEGSVEKSTQILNLYQSLERDPVLQTNPEQYDNSTHEDRELVAARINQMARYLETESYEQFLRRLNLVTVYDPSLGIRLAINIGLFQNCIKGNGTKSQADYWTNYKEAGIVKQLYGCFGMTELGHGSNVAGCETTATFDEATDEFVINTPHIGATKWWIGGAAHSATHTVAYCRLIVKGKDYGVKTFVVPLRDCNHDLLPGIAIGDIGAKMGRSGVDNGWIQFSSVRIPRYYMLQKWCKVARDGTVTLPPLEQLSYISLLGGRVGMATDSYRIAARFTTIALRYGITRRQFKQKATDAQESKLLDYPLHQRRLIPFLALTYAMALGTNRLEIQYDTILKNLDVAIAKDDKKLILQCIQDIKSLFIDSGALKSTLTWLAADVIDQCRQACGGQGYSSYNGFGKAYNDWVVQCTWEGDNNVLSIAVGKTVIANVAQVLKGKPIDSTSSLAWLNNAKELSEKSNVLTSKSDLYDPSKVKLALEVLIVKYAIKLSGMLKANGNDLDKISAQRVRLSKMRCYHYLLETFIEKLSQVSDANLKKHLTKIIQLFSVNSILNVNATDFLVYNIFTPEVASIIDNEFVDELDTQLRPYVIGLTDSFQQPDRILNAFIGKFDGNIYENIHNGTMNIYKPFNSKAPYSPALESMLNRQELNVRLRNEKSPEAARELSK